MKKNIFFIGILFVFVACDEEKERQKIIDAAINLKVEDYKTKRLEEEKRKELDEAVHIADSILLFNADLWQISMDSLGIRPPRVNKPGAPDLTIAVDSSPIKPLFPFKK
jgi:hypothetical protein